MESDSRLQYIRIFLSLPQEYITSEHTHLRESYTPLQSTLQYKLHKFRSATAPARDDMSVTESFVSSHVSQEE